MQQSDWQQQAWQQPASVPPAGVPHGQQQPYAAQPNATAPYPVTAQPQRRGWIVALVAVVLLFVALMFGMFSCSKAVAGLGTFGSAALSESVAVTSGDTVAVIEIAGTIQYDGTTCSPEGLKAKLDEAAEDPNIKAVVLRVDSGGGTAAAGEEMASYVRDFSKPTVVSTASANASAAYEVSSQADWIFTTKSASVGSIGTALQITDLSGLYELLGINVQNVTSAGSKDSTYGTRELTGDELQHYQDMVDQINESFIENVAAGRGMDVEEVRALATGMSFTGVDAVDNGLADEIGTLEDAIAKAAELGGADADCDVVYLSDADYSLETLFGMTESRDASALLEALKELDTDGTIAE